MRYLLILIFIKSLSSAICVNPNDNNYYLSLYTTGYYIPANVGVDPLPDGTWTCINDRTSQITHHQTINYKINEFYTQYNAGTTCTAPKVIAIRGSYQFCEDKKDCVAPQILDSVTNTCYTPETPPPPPPPCNYTSNNFLPSNDWIYRSLIKNETDCHALVDGVLYSSAFFQNNSNGQCENESYCYVKPIIAPPPPDDNPPTPDNNNTTPPPPDSNNTTPPPPSDNNPPPSDNNNSSSVDFSPLLSGQNEINSNLINLKSKSDSMNSNLESIKNHASTTNTKLDDVKNSINSGNQNTVGKLNDLTQSLGNAANGLGSSINSVGDKISDLNSKIDGGEVDTSVFEGFDNLVGDSSSLKDTVLSQFSIFQININNNLSSIQSQYDNASNIFNSGGSASAPSGSLSSDCASFTALGRTISLNLSYLSVISPIVYFIMTAFFMILNFGFLIRHLLKGSD